ncbi:hypothetical protein BC830DRAFT_1082665 [Chytriomyces sp. MP71]|nr:hypothetical protein BC830DRAFT_1082665 [Chytriomyces sp. MP71]
MSADLDCCFYRSPLWVACLPRKQEFRRSIEESASKVCHRFMESGSLATFETIQEGADSDVNQQCPLACVSIPLLAAFAASRISRHTRSASDERGLLHNFIHSIVSKCVASPETLLACITYIARYIAARQKGASRLTKHNNILPFALFLSAFSLAGKYVAETPASSSYLHKASESCFSVQQITAFERKLLDILQFDLRVDDMEAQRVWISFTQYVAQDAGGGKETASSAKDSGYTGTKSSLKQMK